MTNAFQTIEDELLTNLQAFGTETKNDIRQYLNELKPEIDQAMADLDLDALDFIRDRIALKTGNTAINTIRQAANTASTTVSTVLSLLIKIAIGAL